MNSWKRPFSGWFIQHLIGAGFIVPIAIGIGLVSVSLGSLYAIESQAGIITPTMECPWSEAIRKALGDTPEGQSPISDSAWSEAIHNALDISPSTERQGFLLGNNAGVRVSYLSPSASRQFSKSFSKSYGLELYGIFDLKPGDKWAQSRGRFCLEGFIDSLFMKAKDYNTSEWLSDLTSISLGGSVLYKYQERDFGVYLGGGMAYYLNEFTLPREGRDYVRNRFKTKADAYYREEVENTIGFHLRAGAEIQLSGNVFLSLSIKKTFVKPAGVTRQVYALTQKGEIDLSTFASGVGLSLWF